MGGSKGERGVPPAKRSAPEVIEIDDDDDDDGRDQDVLTDPEEVQGSTTFHFGAKRSRTSDNHDDVEVHMEEPKVRRNQCVSVGLSLLITALSCMNGLIRWHLAMPRLLFARSCIVARSRQVCGKFTLKAASS